MKDDDLLEGLRRAAGRDPERERTEKWERLAAGTASADERRAMAELLHEEGDDAAMEALAPLDPELLDRVDARIAPAQIAPAQIAPAPARPSRRRAAFAGGVAALAIAAGIAFFVMRGGSSEDLPAYALNVTGDRRAVRGDAPKPNEVAIFDADSTVRLLLRPATDVNGPLDVAAALVEGGAARAWTPPMRVSPAGAVEIEGPVSALLGTAAGEREIVVAVGRRDALPRDAAAIAALADRPGVRVLRVRVKIAP